MWLASRCVNTNSSNANFNVRNVNSSNVNTNNLCNGNSSNLNENPISNCAVRPLASIHCGYTINDCIRDNIETNYVHYLDMHLSIK